MRNTMKTLAMALCLTALFVGTTLQAQENGKREHKGERQNALYEKLDLSDDQKAKFTEIQKQYRAQISEVRNQGRSPETRKKIQSLYTQQDAEVKELLTEEQFAIYEKSKRKGRRSKSGTGN